MSGFILRVEGISKGFFGVQVLKDVYFEVCVGEVFVFVGENGVGKLILMKIFFGIYIKDEGIIMFEGWEVEFISLLQVQEFGIMIIYQEFNLMFDLIVVQNIYVGCEFMMGLFLLEWKFNCQMVELLQCFDIYFDLWQCVGELIVVEQQMVEIVKVLFFNVKVFIMDEFILVFIDIEVEILFVFIEQFKVWGIGIVYILYCMDELCCFVDWVIVFCDGIYIGLFDRFEIIILMIIEMMVGCVIDEVICFEVCEYFNDLIVFDVQGLFMKILFKDVFF